MGGDDGLGVAEISVWQVLTTSRVGHRAFMAM